MFTIRKDHIGTVAQDGELSVTRMPLYGIERAAGLDDRLPTAETSVKFRLYDDDGELYYEGVLEDDDDCENQTAALRWGESMAGCTRITVERDGEYVQEIG